MVDFIRPLAGVAVYSPPVLLLEKKNFFLGFLICTLLWPCAWREEADFTCCDDGLMAAFMNT